MSLLFGVWFLIMVFYITFFPVWTMIFFVVVPWLVAKLLHYKMPWLQYSSFLLPLIGMTVLANFYWGSQVYGHVYGLGLRDTFYTYSPFFYEQPELSPLASNWMVAPAKDQFWSSSWLAPGWTMFELYVLWLKVTIVVYAVPLLITGSVSILTKTTRSYLPFLLISSLILMSLSVVFGMMSGWVFQLTMLVYIAVPIYFLSSWMFKKMKKLHVW